MSDSLSSAPPLFEIGAPVKVIEGVLAGVEGFFSEQDSEGRVIVLLELLGKANKVRLSRDWVVRAAA